MSHSPRAPGTFGPGFPLPEAEPLTEQGLAEAMDSYERRVEEERRTPRTWIVSPETYAKAQRLGLVAGAPAPMGTPVMVEPSGHVFGVDSMWDLFSRPQAELLGVARTDAPEGGEAWIDFPPVSMREMARQWWIKQEVERQVADFERSMSRYGMPVDVLRQRQVRQPSGNAKDRRRARRKLKGVRRD